MGKLLGREAALVAVVALFSMYVIPSFFDQPPAVTLGLVGLMMGLTYMALYAMVVLLGIRIPAGIRYWLGPIAWVMAFWGDLVIYEKLTWAQARVDLRATYVFLAPGVYGLVVPALAALRADMGKRKDAALDALYAYSVPMLLVYLLLRPMVRVNEIAMMLSVQAGAIYMFLRVLVRIYWPGSVEGGSGGPLVHRPVPDAIVGLVEGTTGRSARPYATMRDGGKDHEAISVLCRPDEVFGVVERLVAALKEKPFQVKPGQHVDGKVEVVVKRKD